MKDEGKGEGIGKLGGGMNFCWNTEGVIGS